MLARVLESGASAAARPGELGVAGLPESDVQVVAQRVLAGASGIGLTVLARPGDVRVLLLDGGAGERMLDDVAAAICHDLGDACYSHRRFDARRGRRPRRDARRVTLATAESCTGGMVAAALTDVPGSSDVVPRRRRLLRQRLQRPTFLGVPAEILAQHGAVSAETVREMARGCARAVRRRPRGRGDRRRRSRRRHRRRSRSGPCGSTPAGRRRRRCHPPATRGDRAAVRARSTVSRSTCSGARSSDCPPRGDARRDSRTRDHDECPLLRRHRAPRRGPNAASVVREALCDRSPGVGATRSGCPRRTCTSRSSSSATSTSRAVETLRQGMRP